MSSRNTENQASRPAKRDFSRRDFLQLAGVVAGLGLTASFIPWKDTLDSAVRLGTSSGEFDSEHSGENLPLTLSHPALIERLSPSPRPAFVRYSGGHRDYLKHIVLHNFQIQKNIAHSYNRLLEEKNEDPSLADLLGEHIELARKSFSESPFEFEKASGFWQMYQCLAMATYSLTAVLGSWIEMKEFRKMGVRFPSEYSDTDEHGVAPTYQLWRLFPSMFPLKVGEGIDPQGNSALMMASGKDRTVHFFHHFFLASRYLGLTLGKNQDAERIPAFIKPAVAAGRDMYEKAKILSEVSGFGWEFKETFSAEDLAGNFKYQPGLLDPASFTDMRANRWGAEYAVKTMQYLVQNKNKTFDELLGGIMNIFSTLDEPFFKTPQGVLRNRNSEFMSYFIESID